MTYPTILLLSSLTLLIGSLVWLCILSIFDMGEVVALKCKYKAKYIIYSDGYGYLNAAKRGLLFYRNVEGTSGRTREDAEFRLKKKLEVHEVEGF